MAKSENQKLKILYLYEMLLKDTDEDNGLTINDIIERLNKLDIQAERKSLYRDIEALNEFGLSIDTKRIDNKTFYYVADRDFELPEVKLLIDVVQGSKFITKKKSETLIKKIEGLASKSQAKTLSRQVFVSNRIKAMNESIYYVVDDLHHAINTNRMISFKYFRWNSEGEKELRHDGKTYIMSPWALSWDDEKYYLIAYDSEEKIIRHFRVDKMQNLKVLDEEREGRENFQNFDMGLYQTSTFGMYGGEEATVTLLCSNDTSDPVIDRFGKDIFISKAGADKFRVSVKVKLSPVFYTWVMNFSGNVVIESPKKAVEGYLELAKKAINSVK